VLTLLADRWPRCFALDRERQPLAVGIRAEIERQLPEVDPRLLRRALNFYVASMAYQRCLTVPGAVRVALDGGASGTVTAEQASRAMSSVAALAEKQGSRLARKAGERSAVVRKTTAVSPVKTVPVSKPPEPGIPGNEKPRSGLRDLREAGRRRAASNMAKG
jgi:ProP effector